MFVSQWRYMVHIKMLMLQFNMLILKMISLTKDVHKNGGGSCSGNILHNAAAETIIYWFSWCNNLKIIKNTLIAVRLQSYIASSYVNSY